MSEEWGPWIEHDGKGCPCVGHCGQSEFNDPSHTVIGPTVFTGHPEAWDWGYESGDWYKVTRYRIRKPRGLTILEGLLENLPEEVDA